ncbi:hypothetical protein AgCh_022921 [Apium graveolens]
MELSLLILYEPTSGLDSSSSSLLLKALRREVAEGVNVYMVVHQLSYTLYKMFDDLVLLSKGGLTAYHGPVKKFHSNHNRVIRYKYINSGSRFDIRSHWEKMLLMNEIMTGSVYTRSVVSKMTLDFLEDSGWYKANYSMADHLESSHNPSTFNSAASELLSAFAIEA